MTTKIENKNSCFNQASYQIKIMDGQIFIISKQVLVKPCLRSVLTFLKQIKQNFRSWECPTAFQGIALLSVGVYMKGI